MSDTKYIPNQNEAHVLQEMYVEDGPLNRHDLRKRTPLKSHQVYYVTEKLAENGYLINLGIDEEATNPGSPPVKYSLSDTGRILHQKGNVSVALPADADADGTGTDTYSAAALKREIESLQRDIKSTERAVGDAEMPADDRRAVEEQLSSIRSTVGTLEETVQTTRVYAQVAYWAAIDQLGREQVEEWLDYAQSVNPEARDVDTCTPSNPDDDEGTRRDSDVDSVESLDAEGPR